MHDWHPYSELEEEDYWEITSCIDNPNCEYPKNSSGDHIRCIQCHRFPPFREPTPTGMIWFDVDEKDSRCFFDDLHPVIAVLNNPTETAQHWDRVLKEEGPEEYVRLRYLNISSPVKSSSS